MPNSSVFVSSISSIITAFEVSQARNKFIFLQQRTTTFGASSERWWSVRCESLLLCFILLLYSLYPIFLTNLPNAPLQFEADRRSTTSHSARSARSCRRTTGRSCTRGAASFTRRVRLYTLFDVPERVLMRKCHKKVFFVLASFVLSTLFNISVRFL